MDAFLSELRPKPITSSTKWPINIWPKLKNQAMHCRDNGVSSNVLVPVPATSYSTMPSKVVKILILFRMWMLVYGSINDKYIYFFHSRIVTPHNHE